MRRLISVTVFALALVSAGGVRVAAQVDTVRLQILSGKTGRPVTKVRVHVWSGDEPHTANAPVLTTDGEGYATIPDSASDFLLVEVEKHPACAKSQNHTYTIADLRARGIVSENLCSKRIHLYPEQGTLIVFVREQTYWERWRQ